MKKLLLILLIGFIILGFVIITLPKLSNKETCTYDEAVKEYAKGKIIIVDGKKVHYIEKGNGKPLILIHGFLYHTIMWQQQINVLAQKYKVYAIDLWGFGYSERLNDYSFEQYGKEILGFLDALKIKKATLIGQSMGGGISVYVAAHHSERIDKLILVAPAVLPYPNPMSVKMYQLPYIGEFMNAIPGDALLKNNIKTFWFSDKSKVSDEYCKEVLQPLCIKGSYYSMMYIFRNVLKAPFVENEANMLVNKDIPILIIHSKEDKTVPFNLSEKLNSMWKRSKLVAFEKGGHSPHEEFPEKFNKEALDFLSK